MSFNGPAAVAPCEPAFPNHAVAYSNRGKYRKSDANDPKRAFYSR